MVQRSFLGFSGTALLAAIAISAASFGFASVTAETAVAQDRADQNRLPWQQRPRIVQDQPAYGNGQSYRRAAPSNSRTAQNTNRPYDPYSPGNTGEYPRPQTDSQSGNYGGAAPSRTDRANDAYVPPRRGAGRYASPDDRSVYRSGEENRRHGANRQYQPPRDRGAERAHNDDGYRSGRYEERDRRSPRVPHPSETTYSENEVIDAGHRFFGSLSSGLAKAIQWAFKNSGRPNGYILGEDAGGAFVAGLRYGEGRLYTKNYGTRRVFWQGPSIGYDFGGDGNRTMTLVYNLRSPSDVYRRFGGVQGSAYLVGGVSVQFLVADKVKLAPIRTGVGVRLGANIGYLKFTRRPTWNPF